MLQGTVVDDGLPNPPGTLKTTWSKADGPGDVVFSAPHALQTTASFSLPGIYALKLAATDGVLWQRDLVIVRVNELAPTPTATPSPSATPSATPTATPKPSATPSPTGTASPSTTPKPSVTPTPSPGASPTPARTPRPPPTPPVTVTGPPSPTPIVTTRQVQLGWGPPEPARSSFPPPAPPTPTPPKLVGYNLYWASTADRVDGSNGGVCYLLRNKAVVPNGATSYPLPLPPLQSFVAVVASYSDGHESGILMLPTVPAIAAPTATPAK